MNLKSFLFLTLGVFVSTHVMAQSNVLNAKTPAEMNQRTEAQIAQDNDNPLPYGFIDKRDVLWG